MESGRQNGFRIHAWGADPSYETFAMPEIDGHEVLIEVEACGVGRTVLNAINGNLQDGRAGLPRVPGHELVGKVTDIGAMVDPDLIARRVTPYFYLFCGMCGMCGQGRHALCENPTGRIGIHRDGGYAPWVALPADSVVPLSDAIDPIAATVIADAVATPVHVVSRAAIVRGDRVAVIGAGGGVGMHMLQMVARAGAEVCGLDISHPKLAEIERRTGRAVDAAELTTVDGSKLFLGGAPTAVIDLVGSAETLRWALDSVGAGGRVVTMTTFPGQEVPLSAREMVGRELMVIGCRYATWHELQEAARLVEEGTIEPVIGSVVAWDELIPLHRALEDHAVLGRGALDWRPRDQETLTLA